jgi:hypothetical protein
MDQPDYPKLESAYLDTVVGTNPPNVMVARGDWIMAHDVDLRGQLDAHRLYYLTPHGIVVSEPEPET